MRLTMMERKSVKSSSYSLSSYLVDQEGKYLYFIIPYLVAAVTPLLASFSDELMSKI